MLNLPHGQEILGLLRYRSLLLRSILRLVRLNGLSVGHTAEQVLRGVEVVLGVAAFIGALSGWPRMVG